MVWPNSSDEPGFTTASRVDIVSPFLLALDALGQSDHFPVKKSGYRGEVLQTRDRVSVELCHHDGKQFDEIVEIPSVDNAVVGMRVARGNDQIDHRHASVTLLNNGAIFAVTGNQVILERN